MKKATWPVLLACALAATSAVRAEIVEIAWDVRGEFAKSLSVPAGRFAELCGKLHPGQSIHWEFSGKAPLDFNIHYHLGEKVEYPVKKDAVAQLQGELGVRDSQDYCWMWRNRSSEAVSFEVSLKKR